jgi:predicted nicotinamide N-methyase
MFRDAGLLLSAYLSSLSQTKTASQSSKTLPQLPILKKALSKGNLKVVELGAGCGIVGITLATLYPQISNTLLTDLPEATDIVTQNLSPSALNSRIKSRINHQVLDWASPLPTNVKETKWDLVVVADCTYNPDVVPDLVQTLKRIGEGNEDVVVLLAMKVRHDSEMVFFGLMDEGGFAIKEKCARPLPVLGEEDEEIEIFVFGLK